MLRSKRLHYGPWEHAISLDALRRAWQPVRANHGTSGADGQTIDDFERHLERNLTDLRRELLDGSYKPQRVTEILVPKAGSSWRPLTIWAVRDRIAQRAIHDYLEPVFEQRFLDCSYGFRPGRSTADAARAISDARQAGTRWVLDADIKDCFGSMRSDYIGRLLHRWRVPVPVRRLIQRWLEARVWNAWRRQGGQVGTAQGSAISPLLCNLYLHHFDHVLSGTRGLWLVRYADDFVVLSRGKGRIRYAHRRAARELQRAGLQIDPQKTRLTTFEDGFQFVGWFFVGDEMYQLR